MAKKCIGLPEDSEGRALFVLKVEDGRCQRGGQLRPKVVDVADGQARDHFRLVDYSVIGRFDGFLF